MKYNKCKICNGDIELINEKHNLVKCSKCEFIFCKTIFSQEQFIKVYDDLYNKENSEYQRHSKTEYDQIVNKKMIKIGYNRTKLINRNILKINCQSVLEIGSGIGLIGAYILSKNANIDYVGIELDKEAFIKSQKLNLNTINGDFTKMGEIEKQFDVIMLWEVIEHLQDLNLFMELAYKKLKVGGRIILSTPNYNKIINYPTREKDQLFQNEPPVHLNFFTVTSIKSIFDSFQFQNIKAEVKKYPYLELGKKRFYVDCIKALFNKYEGSTIYLQAIKKR